MPRFVARVRLAIDDERKDAVLATQLLEGQDFLIDPTRGRGGGRADHDQMSRLRQGRLGMNSTCLSVIVLSFMQTLA